MRVAVAVVSWNTRELLRANLDALRADAEAGRAEVWVVDNGSEDGSPAMVAEEYHWVTLVQPGENLGFGRAVNRVAARTATEWIAPANADVALRPGALEALLAAGEADPGAGVLGPRLLRPDGSVQPSVQPFPTLANAVLGALRLYKVIPAVGRRLYLRGWWDPDRGARVDWVTGAFLLVRREAWDVVGGFDESQWMYAEDVDLAWRAARAGWATRYVPEAVVGHQHGAASVQAFGASEADRRWIAATYAWMADRQGVTVAWAVAATNVLEAGARWLILSALQRGEPSRRAERRASARALLGVHARGLRPRRSLDRSR